MFGILAYSEPVTPFKVLGIVGVLIALTLLTFSEGADQEADKPQEKKKFNVKWLLYCMGMIVTNTLLSVLAKVRQERVGGVNPFAYMALCYTFTFVLSAITYAFLQIKNRTFQRDFFNAKESAVSIGLQSFGNSAANLLVMFLISRVDVSIVYPVETGVALVLSACCGFVFFKEKKTAQKLFGIVLGIVAIVILSI
ncbi:MAG: EamA family transporter [Clostridia bacterium]|nr:EamA family transporter [Clostridia bacterium]